MGETASVTSMNYAATEQTTPSIYEIDPITRIIGVPSDLPKPLQLEVQTWKNWRMFM